LRRLRTSRPARDGEHCDHDDPADDDEKRLMATHETETTDAVSAEPETRLSAYPRSTTAEDIDAGRWKGRPVRTAMGCLISVVAAVALVLLAGSLALDGCNVNLNLGLHGSRTTGKKSKRLDIVATPINDLVDGQGVQVSTAALRGHDIVGIAQCLREAGSRRAGFDACDQNTVVRYPNQGPTFGATFTVHQVLTVKGRAYDCAATAGRCLLVASDAADYDRSGGRPLTFRPNPVPLVAAPNRPGSAHLPISGTPTGPLPSGTRIQIITLGLQPGEPLLYARCTDQLDASGLVDTCEPLDNSAAISAIAFNKLPEKAPTASADGTAAVSLRVEALIKPFGDVFHGSNPAPVDCTERPGRCSIVIAAAADPHRSAVLPYDVTRH
jgi:hypothetical protein